MSKTYLKKPVTEVELKALAALAADEERAFFQRNAHLVSFYRARLMAIALCQGAALQFLGRGYGVNDFDVHYFYAQNPDKPRLSRPPKRIVATVGRFNLIRVDFIRTVVPGGEPASKKAVIEQLRAFLRTKPTPNATHLSEKAVVGLFPAKLFGVTIWPVA